MADTLHELISEATEEFRSKADALDHRTTSIEELRELATQIATDKAEHVCMFPSRALEFLVQSGQDGWNIINEQPTDVYGGDTPLTLILRNIEESVYDELYDEAAMVQGEWIDEAAEEEGDDYDDVPDFDQSADGTFHAI